VSQENKEKADAAMNAGEMLESLGLIWQKATLEEKYKLLSGMLETIYVDLAASRSVVRIQPKPPFYPLFEALKQKPGAKVTLFTPGSTESKDSTFKMESENFGMVETGEGWTPSKHHITGLIRERNAFAIHFSGECQS